MTAPYYSDALVTLYHGDCRELTQWLGADVLVTDPPYGRQWTSRPGLAGDYRRRPGGKRTARAPEWGIDGDTDTSVRDDALAMWGSRPAAVFADLMLGPPPRAKLPLVYAKPVDAGGRGGLGGWRRDIEAVYLLGDGWPSQVGGRTAVLRTGAGMVGTDHGLSARYGHPHAKPVDVCAELVTAAPPGVIADPFAGAGSILVAARMLGRQVIAVEIEEQWAERCARRLSQGDLVVDGGP
jgi:DNA methylase